MDIVHIQVCVYDLMPGPYNLLSQSTMAIYNIMRGRRLCGAGCDHAE